MSLETDRLIDRRRLKHKLAWWRGSAIVAAVALVLVGVARVTGLPRTDYVARLTVTGVIFDTPLRDQALARIAEDDRAKALIVRVNSPGGSFVGGEALFAALRKVAARKPVVAVMGTVAASGGYMAAIAADRIIAREGTITGSIGVIMQSTDITGLLAMVGIRAQAIKSGPLKAVPSPFEPMTERARAAIQSVIDDMSGRFIDMVAERRRLDRATARRLADGRVFSGRQARELGLVDGIGGEDAARDWLADAKGVARGLEAVDVTIRRATPSWRRIVTSIFEKSALSERLTLDGLVSLWHPGLGIR